jgi:acyl-activating enzyme 14
MPVHAKYHAVFLLHRRYSASTALQLIRQHQVTAMIAVPAMMQDIVTAAGAAADGVQQQQQQQQQQQLSSLRRVLVGAGGMSQQLQQAVTALFPNAQLSTAYGMTEGSSSITFISLPQQQQLMAAAAAGGAAAAAAAGVCVGWPAPGIAVKIQPAAAAAAGPDQQQQQHLLFSGSSGGSSSVTSNIQQQQQQQQQAPSSFLRSVGEVCTRGPHVMQRYWAAPDATAQTLSPDGWLHTGDLGYLDAAGCLWLLGRAKDMVKTGGENVHAAEVEGVLLRHPGLAAAAVIGLPHVRLGEQVAAAVVLRDGWHWQEAGDGLQQQQQQQQQGLQQQVVDVAVLQQHCRAAGLSAYKLPRVIVQLQGLPLNSSGKVVKAAVREQMLQQQQQQELARAAAVLHRSRL